MKLVENMSIKMLDGWVWHQIYYAREKSTCSVVIINKDKIILVTNKTHNGRCPNIIMYYLEWCQMVRSRQPTRVLIPVV
jgi:hypothetical protein